MTSTYYDMGMICVKLNLVENDVDIDIHSCQLRELMADDRSSQCQCHVCRPTPS